MNIMAMFDKSFLHGLSQDEAALFDVLFMSNITPLFYIETLADLEKKLRDGRTPEQVVGNLADKTPRLHSYPNVPHWEMTVAELMGHVVEMQRRPIVGGAHAVQMGDKAGMLFDVPPEMEAMDRWSDRDFLTVERLHAKRWRAHLAAIPQDLAVYVRDGLGKLKFSGLDEIKAVADSIHKDGRRFETLKAVMAYLGLPADLQMDVLGRWKRANGPPLKSFMPYTTHVLNTEIFYLTAVASGHIDANRASNRVDIGYLFYLPFTQIFISGDKLHRRVAPLFLGKDQAFVWAHDLKADLAKLDTYFSADPRVHVEGLMRIAKFPPTSGDFLVTRLYDRFCPRWREHAAKPIAPVRPMNPALKEKFDTWAAAERVQRDLSRPEAELDMVRFERKVPIRRGKWQFLPPGVDG